jgi:hypothetical protein
MSVQDETKLGLALAIVRNEWGLARRTATLVLEWAKRGAEKQNPGRLHDRGV